MVTSGGLRPPTPHIGGSATFGEERLGEVKRDLGNQMCAPPGANLIAFFFSAALSHLVCLTLSLALTLSRALILSRALSHLLLLSHSPRGEAAKRGV